MRRLPAKPPSRALERRARAVVLVAASGAYDRRRAALTAAKAFGRWEKCVRAERVRERVTELAKFIAEIESSHRMLMSSTRVCTLLRHKEAKSMHFAWRRWVVRHKATMRADRDHARRR